jgi:peroxiredoxin
VFAASLGTLPYPLCSDWHKKTSQTYGVYDETNLVAKRSVFLIDQKGKLRYINKEFDANKKNHYEAVFSELKKLV